MGGEHRENIPVSTETSRGIEKNTSLNRDRGHWEGNREKQVSLQRQWEGNTERNTSLYRDRETVGGE